ncbi:MAG: HAD-IIB family hydrolase [Phycisphaerae bacterium]
MKYKMLALDVDGTIVGPDGEVAPETIQAVTDIARRGVRVVIATGRSHVETHPVWEKLQLVEPHEPMIVVGGALVAEPRLGRTLYQVTMPNDVAAEFGTALNEMGYTAAGVVDPWRWGVEYFVAESDDAEFVREAWLDKMDREVKVQFVQQLGKDGCPPLLRITAIVDMADGRAVEQTLRKRFGDRLELHFIAAPNYGVRVIEAFASGVSKWTALNYIAQRYRIGAGQIVAVGDDVNDVPMLEKAGLGAAMPQALPHVKAAADVVVDTTLGSFLRRLMDGATDSLVETGVAGDE